MWEYRILWCIITLQVSKEYDSENNIPSWLDSVTSCSLLSFTVLLATFLNISNREMLGTFTDNRTLTTFIIDRFQNSDKDEIKFDAAFGNLNSIQMLMTIHSQIKIFVDVNWYKWNEQKPEWFTKEAKNSIPEEFLPKSYLKARNELKKTEDARKAKNKADKRTRIKREVSIVGGEIMKWQNEENIHTEYADQYAEEVCSEIKQISNKENPRARLSMFLRLGASSRSKQNNENIIK